MASNIDPTHPETGVAVPKATSRANWQAAKEEIEDLQERVEDLEEAPGGGASTFTDLTDTPGTIAAEQFVRGNSGGTALEFVTGDPGDADASTTNYTPAGTDAVTRSVKSRLDEAVSITDFGAVPNDSGTSAQNANVAAFNAAIAYITAVEGTRRIPLIVPGGEFYINDTITVGLVRNFICYGRIHYTGTGTALVIGSGQQGNWITNAAYHYRIRLWGPATGADTRGIRVRNLTMSTVEVLECNYFDRGLWLAPLDGEAVGYCNFILGDLRGNRHGIHVGLTGEGWTNENQFVGGEYHHSGWAGGGTTRGVFHERGSDNVYYSLSIEDADESVALEGGFNNRFRDLRIETSGPPRFAGVARHNVVGIRFPSDLWDEHDEFNYFPEYKTDTVKPNFCGWDHEPIIWSPLTRISAHDFQRTGSSWALNKGFFVSSSGSVTPIDPAVEDVTVDYAAGTFTIGGTNRLRVRVDARRCKLFRARVIPAVPGESGDIAFQALDASGAVMSGSGPQLIDSVTWVSPASSNELRYGVAASNPVYMYHTYPFQVADDVAFVDLRLHPGTYTSIEIWGQHDWRNRPVPTQSNDAPRPPKRIVTADLSTTVPDFIGQTGYDYGEDIVYMATGFGAGAWKALTPWTGTQAQYDALTPDSGTSYEITD